MLSLKENIAKVIPDNLFFLDLVEYKAQSRIKIIIDGLKSIDLRTTTSIARDIRNSEIISLQYPNGVQIEVSSPGIDAPLEHPFQYKKNIGYLHNDDRLMPDSKNAWSSWNSILDKNDTNKNCVTYWLNKLQNLKTKENYFLTLNPFISIDASKIIKKVEFTHPFYDIKTINAQKYLSELQGVNNTYFCGSYFG